MESELLKGKLSKQKTKQASNQSTKQTVNEKKCVLSAYNYPVELLTSELLTS